MESNNEWYEFIDSELKNEDLITLNKAINDVVGENDQGKDARTKMLQRKVNKLFMVLGINKDDLKEDGKHYLVHKKHLPYLNVLLYQAYNGTGIVGKLIDNKSGPDQVTYEDFSDLMDDLCKEGRQQGLTDDEIRELWIFYDNLLNFSPRKHLTECHKMIDLIAGHLEGLSIQEKTKVLQGVASILRCEMLIQAVEVPINIEKFLKEAEDLLHQNIVRLTDGEMKKFSEAYRNRLSAIMERLYNDPNLYNYLKSTSDINIDDIFSR